MSQLPNIFIRFVKSLLKIYRIFRSIVLNFLFVFVILLVVASMAGNPPVVVQPGSALVLAPKGVIVEQKSYINPFDNLLSSSLTGSIITAEVLLQDVLDALEIARDDSSISALIISLDELAGGGLSQLQSIGDAIEDFRSSGKKVYATADHLTQAQYYLASYADEIIINPMGGVDLQGLGAYQTYYHDALNRLGVNVHIFRVGEYKSAVEPYERNNMSAEARMANLAWLEDLWQLYLDDIASQRNMSPVFIQQFIDTLDQQLANFAGNSALMALDHGFVDQVFTRTELDNKLEAEIGTGLNGELKQIAYKQYLSARNNTGDNDQEKGKIGLIVASGTILDGNQLPGNIGGDSLARLIVQAAEDDSIRGLVLRIDSPGGSAFASEIIRSALLDFKATGKSLFVSMGSVAASGGYWIASPADMIWASPSTITGSIGIFSIYPTFEDTFSKIGINTDGVGTTNLAGAFATGNALPELASNAIQLNLQYGYEKFLSIVSEGRNLSREDVDAIARGRVWSGLDAYEIGLVDELGDLQEVVATMAEQLEMENPEVQIISAPLSPRDLFLQSLAENAWIKSFIPAVATRQVPGSLQYFLGKLEQDFTELVRMNDPKQTYLQCLECNGQIF